MSRKVPIEQRIRWLSLFMPEDTSPTGARPRETPPVPGSILDRLKGIFWLAMGIVSGLAIGRL